MNRKQRYEHSDAGKARKKAYRQRNGKHVTSAKYQSKPFIALGSQPLLKEDGTIVYAHLALSTGQSITNLNGLTTNEALTFLCSNTPTSKQAILTVYGSTYDFNELLSSATLEQLETIYKSTYKSKPTPVGLYKVKLARGQSLTVYDLFDEIRTINDVYNFFQVPLKNAVNEYLNKDVRGGSAYHKAVTLDNFNTATKQLRNELAATVELMNEFRRRLDKVNLRPRVWSGAGSITTNLFERHKVKETMREHEPDVARAARYAYAGGRFELVRYGSVTNKKTFAYDINSAYPEGLTKLPVLAGGRWHHIAGDPGNTDYGLYKIKITTNKRHYYPTPLFARATDGSISYPNNLEGWYWAPEIAVVREWAKLTGATYEIDQAYIFEPATDNKPFAWIEPLYEQRRHLKEINDEAEVGLKLALNSAYGKLAQQVGWIPADENGSEELTPSYHQLDWAGYVTSYTRAKLFAASLECYWAVIAYETDAVYMSEELTGIIIGEGLGEWKETIYLEMTYLNSGIYTGIKENGEIVFKLRGVQAGTVDIETMLESLKLSEPNRKLKINQIRYVSGSLALANNAYDKWRTFSIEPLEIRLYPSGKRAHYLCSCPDGETLELTRNFWHTTIPVKPFRGATEYSVEWINPDQEQLIRRNKTRLNLETTF